MRNEYIKTLHGSHDSAAVFSATYTDQQVNENSDYSYFRVNTETLEIFFVDGLPGVKVPQVGR
ncbi:MAG: hypothetical protein ACLTZT_15690 [Butyricimonas faecalis]